MLSDINGAQQFSAQIQLNDGITEYQYKDGNELSSGTYIVNVVRVGKPVGYKIVKR